MVMLMFMCFLHLCNQTTYTVQSEAPAMQLRQRGVRSREASGNTEMSAAQELSWRRIFNLIVAITVHNIPG